MEDLKKTFTGIEPKILSGFNDILNIIGNKIGVEGYINSLERGTINSDFKLTLRDYFSHTHGQMSEKLNTGEGIPITKLNLSNGKDIILSTDFHKQLRGKNIKFLDLIMKQLHPEIQNILIEKIEKIHNLEKIHFNSKKHIEEEIKFNILKVFI